jgi:hypothetical protein
MQVGDLIRAVGGTGRVAERIGCTASAVSQWRRAGIPREHHLAVWRMALEAGLPWEPPGADAIRHLLQAAPADRKVA